MRKSLQLLGCFAILAASVMAVPAHANHADGHKGGARTIPPMTEQTSVVTREDLENERDRVRLKCMDAKGQDRSACEGRMQSIRDRMSSAPAMDEKKEMTHKKGMRKTDWKQEHKDHKEHKKMLKHSGKSGARSKPGTHMLEEPPAD